MSLLSTPAWAQTDPTPRVLEAVAPILISQTTSPIPESLGLPATLAELVENVSPAVVNIVVRTETGETTTEGQGSGFIISERGEVVTNFHVIDGGSTISVEFSTGESFSAQIVGTDEETDLALLKIEAERKFPKVDFHTDPPVRIGDWVVAIGNPFGIGQSTSFGVISAIGRSRVDSGNYVDYIQTDATINRGNSGGPLFNLAGEVVGVNSAIYSPTGASVGIAFVIPHGTAEEIIGYLRRDGRVRRGYLGAGLRVAEFELDNQPGIFKAGAAVHNIVDDSPASRHGLKVDDIILNINGQSVRNSLEATRIIGALMPGDIAKVIFERDEKTYQIDIIIDERPSKEMVERTVAISNGLPAPEPRNPGRARVNLDTGVHVLDLSSTFRDAVGMSPDQVGVYVESVQPDSQAAGAGFKSGMIILQADRQDVADVSTYKSIILKAKLADKKRINLRVRLRNGSETTMALPL